MEEEKSVATLCTMTHESRIETGLSDLKLVKHMFLSRYFLKFADI